MLQVRDRGFRPAEVFVQLDEGERVVLKDVARNSERLCSIPGGSELADEPGDACRPLSQRKVCTEGRRLIVHEAGGVVWCGRSGFASRLAEARTEGGSV